MADIDSEDPCVRAPALRAAYYAMLAGGTSTRVRFRDGDNEQEVQKSMSGPTLKQLQAEMWKAEDECRASQGLPPRSRRFAVTAGSRRC